MTALMSTLPPLTPSFQRIAAAAAVAAALAGAEAAGARGLTTGITDPLDSAFAERDGVAGYHVARANGVRVVRVPVVWSSVVSVPPANARDPNDPAYDWTFVDDRVDRIAAKGLEPLLSVYGRPHFARKRGLTPHASDLGAFMTAIARRYDGTRKPRVRLLQIWNEPNLKSFMDVRDGPDDYRAMLASGYAAVKSVHRDNLVVGGGLGPFGGPGGRYGTPPLAFMRRLLSRETPFDVWAHHPYTSGPPARRALAKDDVSLGDLPEMRRVLRAARRAGRIRSTRFWVTEFGWDTKPPDPYAVPVREHARWVAEALYRMWRSGVDLVVWFQLRDNPHEGHPWGATFQSGLYYRTTALYADERPKPALRAFRFPFVALPSGRRTVLSGRTPDSRPNTVLIQRRVRGRWDGLLVLRADRDGIFRGAIRRRRGDVLRAAAGDHSMPFEVRPTRDRRVNPFGGAGPEALREDE
jgi:hypothetical protein